MTGRPSLQELEAKLKGEDFDQFIDVHMDDLCKKTCHSLQLLVNLGFDKGQIEKIKNISVEFDRNFETYQIIKQKGEIEVFLKALRTNNGQIIQLITEWLKKSENEAVCELDRRNSSSVDTSVRAKEWILDQLESGKTIKDLLQRPFDEICQTTTDLERLVILLYSSNSISSAQKDEILEKNSKIDYQRCQQLYDLVAKRGAGKELVEALDKSENGHILRLIQQQNEATENI